MTLFTEDFTKRWMIKSWESKHWRKMREERVDGRKILYERSLTVMLGIPAERMGRETGT